MEKFLSLKIFPNFKFFKNFLNFSNVSKIFDFYICHYDIARPKGRFAGRPKNKKGWKKNGHNDNGHNLRPKIDT